jgi:O-antigen/teichoic acid export membrane protein
VVRQWGSVTLALPCFLASGLHGAVIGYLVAEAGIFVVAITGARRSFSRWLLRPDWKTIVPLLQVGVVFYLGELVLSAVERSGGLMVRGLTHNYAEVGMFGVSHQIFTAAVASSNQISMSFVPLITVLRSRHEDAELKTWIERLIKWLALAGVLAFLGALILGQDIVPLVLGKAYVPVVSNLVVMVGALLFIPLTHSCSMLALTHDRPGIVFRAALLRLVVFWGAGITLTARWGSLGTCLALFLAIAAQMAFFVWKNRVVVAPAFLRWTLVVGVGLTFAPVAFLRSSRPANVALYLLTAGGFLLAMKALGQISAKDFRALVRALGRDRTTSKPDLPSVTSTI